MAFTGNPVVQLISTRKCRITGGESNLTLAAGASGTISLAGGTGDIKLPAAFNAAPYEEEGGFIDLDASIEIVALPRGQWAGGVTGVVTAAKVAAPFLATIANPGAANSPNLEIYVEFH
jgi:hypothetical protein